MIQLIDSGAKPDAAALLERARQAIAARELPSGISLRVWGGRGSGKICSLCGRPIGSDDVEIELDGIEREGGVRFHSKCHLLWQEACKGPDH